LKSQVGPEKLIGFHALKYGDPRG